MNQVQRGQAGRQPVGAATALSTCSKPARLAASPQPNPPPSSPPSPPPIPPLQYHAAVGLRGALLYVLSKDVAALESNPVIGMLVAARRLTLVLWDDFAWLRVGGSVGGGWGWDAGAVQKLSFGRRQGVAG